MTRLEDLTNAYCSMCEDFPEDCDPEEYHNIRSGFIYCKVCGCVYHPKVYCCKHVKVKKSVTKIQEKEKEKETENENPI